MRKIILSIGFCFLLIGLIFTSSCQKDKKETIAETTNTTPAYIPPQPGSLKINISNLTLHPGNNATIIATLYNSDGSISSASPSLIWQSTNSSISSVTNGTVTANAEGNCEISVTDGIHGILRTNVTVVASSVVIPVKATNVSWSFNANVLVMQPNKTQTIKNYTVYNSSGQVVQSTALTFVPPASSGLSFTGNNITSNASAGSFDVLVKSGNDTLLNTLKVLILNTVDTLTTISAIPNCPYFFPYYDVSAEPLIIQVTKAWIGPSGFQLNLFTTSPTAITIYQPTVAIVNSEGFITSVGPGNSKVKVEYNKAFVEGYIFVDYDFTGSWGGTTKNGDNYNFCFDKENPDVFYRYNLASYKDGSWEGGYLNGLYENGTAKIVKNGITDPLNKAVIYTFPGIGKENKPLENSEDLWFCQFYKNGLTGGTFLWQNDLNKMKYVDGSNTVVLTRGAGDCSGGSSVNDKSQASWYFNGTFKQLTENTTDDAIRSYAEYSEDAECDLKSLIFYTEIFPSHIESFKLTPNITGVGTYQLNSTTLLCYDSYTIQDDILEENKGYVITNGTLVINEYSTNYIGGTFNFSGINEYVLPSNCSITQGIFRIKRQ